MPATKEKRQSERVSPETCDRCAKHGCGLLLTLSGVWLCGSCYIDNIDADSIDIARIGTESEPQ